MGVLKDIFTWKRAVALIVALIAVSVFLFLRGPYISNYLKMAILSELQVATGRQVIAQKIYVNALPLFIEARGVKVFDDEGKRVFASERVKGYVSLRSIIKRRIDVDRVVFIRPELWTDRAQTGQILENVDKYGGKKKKLFSYKLKAVVIREGDISFHDEKYNSIITVSGAKAELVMKDRPELSFSVGELVSSRDDWPDIAGSVKGVAVISEDSLELKNIDINAIGSRIRGGGTYTGGGNGDFSVNTNILINSVKEMFGLKAPGAGEINAMGSVRFDGDVGEPTVDLKLKGEFYLEALMEILKAKSDDYLTGLAHFDGQLSGRFPDLNGSADAWMDDGSFFGVMTDRVKCLIGYSDGILSFRKGRAELYGGKADVKVDISIPKVKPYMVDVRYSGIDIASALGLISLDKLKLSPGKVKGRIYSSGMSFDPEGWADYVAANPSGNAIGRVEKLTGRYRKEGDVLYLSGFEASSADSKMVFDGSLNMSLKTLDFAGNMSTGDINDLLSPYFTRLKGRGGFEGTVTGTVDDPMIVGRLSTTGMYLDKYYFGNIEAEASYRKKILRIISASAEAGPQKASATGTVEFPDAEWLLDLDSSIYNINVSLEKSEMGGLFNIFGIDAPLEGTLDSGLDITGNGLHPVYSGSMSIKDAVVYNRPVAQSSFRFAFGPGWLELKDAVFRQGDSAIALDGGLGKDRSFYLTVKSERTMISDLFPDIVPLDYAMKLRAEGQGKLDEPHLTLMAELTEGRLKGDSIGGGKLNVSLEGDTVEFNSRLLDGNLALEGSGSLEGEMPWSAELQIAAGRYDSLVSPFMKKPPDDFMFSMGGRALMSGTRGQLNAKALFDGLKFNMFGQSFSNESEITLQLDGGKLSVPELVLKSGSTALKVNGNVDLYSSYDIVIEGRSSLSPLMAVSENIDVLRGDAEYVFGISGEWAKPVVNGGLSVSNGTLALRNNPQRLTEINGYVYVYGERAVLKSLGANVGGGDISMSGVARLDGARPEKIYLDTIVRNVTWTVSRDFVMNLGGNVVLKGEDDAWGIAGELNVNRARYNERIEWKRWLLEAGRRAVAKPETEWARKVDLNLRISGQQDINVDNNIVDAPMNMDVVLRGTMGAPLLFGRIESTEGKVYFRNSEFRILNATADYAENKYNDPHIGMQAETSIKGYHIWLNLEGNLDNLDLTLTSDPSLDEVEILTLLAFGEFGENLSGLEGGIGAAEATSFLTGRVQDVLEERVTDIAGLDRFQIDPYVSRSTGTVTPRITVSKKLMREKLFVTYATTGEEQELNLEYLLGNNVSLLGGQNELGSIGGDIKFRFRFE
jgi:translocation and assembly module TamB